MKSSLLYSCEQTLLPFGYLKREHLKGQSPGLFGNDPLWAPKLCGLFSEFVVVAANLIMWYCNHGYAFCEVAAHSHKASVPVGRVGKKDEKKNNMCTVSTVVDILWCNYVRLFVLCKLNESNHIGFSECLYQNICQHRYRTSGIFIFMATTSTQWNCCSWSVLFSCTRLMVDVRLPPCCYILNFHRGDSSVLIIKVKWLQEACLQMLDGHKVYLWTDDCPTRIRDVNCSAIVVWKTCGNAMPLNAFALIWGLPCAQAL